MSQYSEMMGSFIRTGNYPMEANYVFDTEADLRNFYEDDLNATTLHEGLLRVAKKDNDGKQSLFWVVRDSNEDLVIEKLISDLDIDNINKLLEDLQKQLDEEKEKLENEIKERKEADTEIWGTEDKSEINEKLNNILKISKAIEAL